MTTFFPIAFSFFVGAAFGIYLAQNYKVPNVKWWLDEGISSVKRFHGSRRLKRNAAWVNSPGCMMRSRTGDHGRKGAISYGLVYCG
mmetsp:Transcript_43346/g.169668  ORF Transcript_43346/g.169668 Transcript_43346/m.169668 type:complete len:86 (-) Transcript_43346:688-945(-)